METYKWTLAKEIGRRYIDLKEYKKVQIIKHALQLYVKRDGATEKDINQEKRLLNQYADRAEELKKRYKIKWLSIVDID